MTVSENVVGIFKPTAKKYGVLRKLTNNLRSGQDDVSVSAALIKQFGLVEGASVTGTARKGKKGFELVNIESI